MAIPAFLYTLANSLQYIGISNLDAATFQVVYQLKIIVTAMFSVLMLQKSFGFRQWISLVLLMAGVAIVSLPNDRMALVSSHHSRIYSPRSINPLRQRLEQLYLGSVGGSNILKRSASYEGLVEDEWAMNNNAGSDAFSGIIATIGVCICSGFAGVYFEKVMKESHKASSLWIRNVQLSTYSLFPAFFIGVIFLDGETVSRNGFFHGYNWVVFSSVVIQSLGGILAAFVLFYADNISKNFALSISMILSSLLSFVFFDFTATMNVSTQLWKTGAAYTDVLQFMLGFAIVLFSTYLYTTSEKSRPRPPPMQIENFEKMNEGKSPTEARDMSIMMPKTPLANEGSFTSSRPGSPTRLKRKAEHLGYFTKQND